MKNSLNSRQERAPKGTAPKGTAPEFTTLVGKSGLSMTKHAICNRYAAIILHSVHYSRRVFDDTTKQR